MRMRSFPVAGLSWLAALALLVLMTAMPRVAMAQFDHAHTAWNALLARHVVVMDGGHGTRVRYRGLAAERAALRGYLAGLSRVTRAEYDGWSRPQRLAFLINAYNAFTVEKVLTRYPDLKSIRDFGSVFGNPWKDRFFTLLGKAQHLDGIEHETIRAPGAFDEPRIHFAVNCAAIGCPALREEAYVAARLEAQLEAQTVRFLSDRSRNRVSGDVLEVSRIFDWYGEDFATGHRGWTSLGAFFAANAQWLNDREEVRQLVRDNRMKIRFREYDWALNDEVR
jgi:hypothetical protein